MINRRYLEYLDKEPINENLFEEYMNETYDETVQKDIERYGLDNYKRRWHITHQHFCATSWGIIKLMIHDDDLYITNYLEEYLGEHE